MLGQGRTTAEACRRIAVSEQTYYRWRNNQSAEFWMHQAIPFGRLAKTERVAKSVQFLALSESSFIGSEEVLVDGGFVAVRTRPEIPT